MKLKENWWMILLVGLALLGTYFAAQRAAKAIDDRNATIQKANQAMIEQIKVSMYRTSECGDMDWDKISAKGTNFVSVIVIDGRAYTTTTEGWGSINRFRGHPDYDPFLKLIIGPFDSVQDGERPKSTGNTNLCTGMY